jgi:hypothetical protein
MPSTALHMTHPRRPSPVAQCAWPPAARAQSSQPWQFELSLCSWLPGISGTTSFPPEGNGPCIDLSMGDVLGALKFAFFTTFEARKGQWGLGPTWSTPTWAPLAVRR